MPQSDLAAAELIERVHWLIRLRWWAVGGVLVVITLADQLLGLAATRQTLYLIALLLGLYNVALWVAARWLRAFARREAALLANLQISADLFLLALLLHYSGGIENPFIFYFIFHIIIASILLSRRATFFQASLAFLLVLGLAFGERSGALAHHHFKGLPMNGHESGSYLAGVVISLASTLYFAAYMATSITGRLRAREAEIVSLSAELESEAAELQRAYAQLQEADRIKSQYLRKVSHELRSPLSAIQSALNVVLEGLTGEVSEKSREMIARAENRTWGLLKITRDLLLLSRAREAQLKARMEPVDLRDTIGRVVELLRPRAQSGEVSLETDLADGLVISGDRESLEQLFTNLVSNAIKYTPPGGRVMLTAHGSEEAVSAEVRDTGIGIPAEQIPSIFEEFFRANNARHFQRDGTGLGLSIAKASVEAHRGEIAVESELGKGTTFRVVLPRGLGAAPSPEGAEAEPGA